MAVRLNKELPNVNANIKRKLIGRWERANIAETETLDTDTDTGLGPFPPPLQ